ncbi:hypothetical protein M9Y10_031992 [Tritrichomonas musculus]|uniref:Enoyl reductase (ER) domain-containing protein n=1 Tax=Tritrichomonas musculus TaxID=1915356 RepID=A0ABR2H118_9EUKA
MKLMNALVKPIAGPGLELCKVPIPEPGPNEVLIKIHKTAICGTDVHIYNWDSWAQENIKPPMVIGHEYVGEVYKLGSNVKNFHIGQRVSGEGHITCGVCPNCKEGNIQWCNKPNCVGVNRSGAFAEYICIPETNVIPIDESIPEDFVSFFDAFGNATHSCLRWDLKDKNILITGAGPIGIMSAGICKHQGARRVVITDINEYRLSLAKKMGADEAINTSKINLNDYLAGENFDGFDIGIEMSGNGDALKQMISLMSNGGKISLLGISKKPLELNMNLIVLKGLNIQGIYGRKMENWKQMSDMVKNGLDLSPVITHRFNYTQFEEGFEAMKSGNSGKVILDWSKN